MNDQLLSVTEIAGSAEAAGRKYGHRFETLIVGFCHQEVKPDNERLAYAARCWPFVQEYAPESAAFMRGMAESTGLSIEHVTLLTLHEEIYVLDTHCTAFAAGGSATRDRETLVAMNWDWNTSLYPWAGLLRLDIEAWPRMLTYHFPGLWAGAGLNECGLAFMWTGAGGFAQRSQLADGVPTYVLINELLRRESVEDAVAYLEAAPFAGAFIFFLGDAAGRLCVVEGFPGHMTTTEQTEALTRANHYECPLAVVQSKQPEPSPQGGTSQYRACRMRELIETHTGEIDVALGRHILTDRDGSWPWLHQYPAGDDAISLRIMTLDSLIADCGARVLHTCRGGRTLGPWQSVPVR